MVTTPTIYTDDESQVGSDLSFTQRRKPIWLNWLSAILTPQQWLNDLVFTKYYGGSPVSLWVAGTPYAYGNDVLYLDNSVYECTNISGVTSTTPPNIDTTNWIKILDTFVGVAERIRYTGQQIMLEYLLNKYFNVGAISLPWTGASHVNQIYIGRDVVINSEFWMATQSEGSPQSYMAIDSSNATSWMPISTSTQQLNSFTIYVPNSVAADITTSITTVIPGSSDTYATLITSIVNNYVRAGKIFNVVTY